MFEEYYQLSKTPFSRDIPTESLYQSHMLEEILGRLEYAAKRQLFAVVTGDSGTGKTTPIPGPSWWKPVLPSNSPLQCPEY
jgi:general secretion pathway protein A